MKRNMDTESDVCRQQQFRPQHPFPAIPDSLKDPSSEFSNLPTGSSESITDCLKKFRAASSVTRKPDGYTYCNYSKSQHSQTSSSAFWNCQQNQQPDTWQDTGSTFSFSSPPFQDQNSPAAHWSSQVPFPPPAFCPSVPPPGLPPFTRPPPSSRNCGIPDAPVGQSPPSFHNPHNFARGLPQNTFRGGPPQNNFGSGPPQSNYGTFPFHSNLRSTTPDKFGNAPLHANNNNSVPPQTGSGISLSNQPSLIPKYAFPQGSGTQLAATQDSKAEPAASEPRKEDSNMCDSEAQLVVNSWLANIAKLKKVGQLGVCEKKSPEISPGAKPEATKNPQQSLSFGEAQIKLRNVLHALAAVQGELQQLEEEHSTVDMERWKTSVMKIKQLKEAYFQAKQEIDVKQLKSIKRKFELRKKKRKRRQQHKQEKRDAEQQALFERAQKHAAIDQWRNNILQRYVHQQQVKQMKETADKTLSKVRREIKEARKMLEAVSALEKLRVIRCDTAEKRGQTFPSAVAEHFKDKAHDLTQLLTQQIEAYEKEEGALKLILETEKEEAEERKKKEKQKKEKELQQVEMEEEKLCLFGPPAIPTPGGVMQPFTSYYQQSVYSLQSLQNIRKEWDQFLVPDNTPMASRVPDGWVCPEPPQSSVWASVLHQQPT